MGIYLSHALAVILRDAEILAGGITTLSTDFRQMGLTLAQLIFQKGIRNIENPWMLNIRRSL